MKKFWFIRHGESESNAGLPTSTAPDISITPKGKRQSELIANYIQQEPDLFVTSPYIRTSQTFQPTRSKFPGVPHEEWPVQEFTYLPPEFYRQTTTKERQGPSREYFQRGDPNYVIGEGGESFNHFRQRVKGIINTLFQRPEQFTIVFGHGWFMRCILWEQIVDPDKNVSAKREFLNNLKRLMRTERFPFWLTRKFGLNSHNHTMTKFLIFSGAIHVPNASILKLSFSPDGSLSLDQYVHDHIPNHLRGRKFID